MLQEWVVHTRVTPKRAAEVEEEGMLLLWSRRFGVCESAVQGG